MDINFDHPAGHSLAAGWFARDAGVLRLVGRQLCPHLVMDGRGPRRFYMAHDIFKLSSVSQLRTADVLARAVQRTIGRKPLRFVRIQCNMQSRPMVDTFVSRRFLELFIL
jgi:hypothetical protein